jgi:hypothetical protein
VQPFDIVEELNRSVEAWALRCHPSPVELQETISRISSFLLEFSRRVSFSSCPQFRRPGLELAALTDFKVLHELLPTSKAQPPPPVLEDYYAVVVKQADPNAVAEEDLAIPSSEKKYFDRVARVQKRSFPARNLETSKYYFFLRWIWISYPWLALHSAATLCSKTASSATADQFPNTGLQSTSEKGSKPLESDHADGTHDPFGDMAHATDGFSGGAAMKTDPSNHLLRVWNVKKADPTVQVFSKSLNRKLAAIKPHSSLSASLERNVDVTYNKLYEELLQPSHLAKVRIGLQPSRDKFRRTFEEEVSSIWTIFLQSLIINDDY